MQLVINVENNKIEETLYQLYRYDITPENISLSDVIWIKENAQLLESDVSVTWAFEQYLSQTHGNLSKKVFDDLVCDMLGLVKKTRKVGKTTMKCFCKPE